MKDAIRTIQKMTGPLHQRVMNAVARAVVRMVNDGPKMQEMQLALTAGELRDQVERVQNYGFSSHPHNGAEAAVVFLGGNRDHGLILAVDDRRYRLKAMEQGEVAIYTDEGDYIHLKRDRNMEISTDTLLIKAETLVRIECPRVETSADLIDQTDGGNSNTVQDMRSIYNGHTHTDSVPGTTTPPHQPQ